MATPARVAMAWCDQHGGFVEEGRTRPVHPDSTYRVCDGCADQARYTLDHPHLARYLHLLEHGLTIEDRAAAYAVLYALQLAINRRLRTPKAELTQHLIRTGTKALGPLSLVEVAVDVAWPCNDPGNWTDVGIQDAMGDLAGRPDMADYVRHIPAHYEIDTARLGEDVAMGVPAAHRLHREMKSRSWRTEASRRKSLRVRTSPTLGKEPTP